jgi:hypothetical protein
VDKADTMLQGNLGRSQKHYPVRAIWLVDILVNISDAMLGTERIYLEMAVAITERKMKLTVSVAPSLPVHGVMPMKADGNQTLLQDIITVNPECYTINHSSPPQSPGSQFREDLLDDDC